MKVFRVKVRNTTLTLPSCSYDTVDLVIANSVEEVFKSYAIDDNETVAGGSQQVLSTEDLGVVSKVCK